MPDIEPDNLVPWHPAEWTVEEVLELPEDSGSRIELVDGVLVVSPAPTTRHQRILGNLYSLRDSAPAGTEMLLGVNVRLNRRRLLIPDLVIVTCPGEDLVYVPAVEVLLAVEIESPSTKMQDRVLKRALYAEANIRYYLLVDAAARPAEATLHELVDGEYREIAHSTAGRITLTSPLAATVDLGA
ncbi:Uma2 family endonuclease [Amycolatopsis sp. GM8]|uniref:Uma2 family endonuclease n=1 Tax=Amycolatopsis sp. GM8 TaxID=2896530 RepID=UPI001F311B51|nr:Uma2 family endonuclease [Amycolatopsis sp. GM8]